MFQSSPGHSTGCNAGAGEGSGQVGPVSILTRSLDRVQRGAGSDLETVGYMFQSSPGHSTGCNCAGMAVGIRWTRFQSSPGHSTGCNTPCTTGCCKHHKVSILTRSLDRVQLSPAQGRALVTIRFNPHPVTRPGATMRVCMPSATRSGFNPHPVTRPGATRARPAP